MSQDLKSGHPKCARACSNEQLFKRQDMKKKKQYSLKSGHSQDTWAPIWLKAYRCHNPKARNSCILEMGVVGFLAYRTIAEVTM